MIKSVYMMSAPQIIILVAAMIPIACSGSLEPPGSQVPNLEDIRRFPVGLRVTHFPNPVGATQGGRSGYAYTWQYETSVEAINKELTIVEFGIFFERDDTWIFSNYTGKPFTGQDFAEWYSCPEARLSPASPAKDPQNWTGSNELRSVRNLWYFIGTDSRGERFRGEAMIEISDKLNGA